jgi:hypothetical protein
VPLTPNEQTATTAYQPSRYDHNWAILLGLSGELSSKMSCFSEPVEPEQTNSSKGTEVGQNPSGPSVPEPPSSPDKGTDFPGADEVDDRPPVEISGPDRTSDYAGANLRTPTDFEKI